MLSRIGKALGLSTSTVATICDKDKIRASFQEATPQAATKLTHSRCLAMENTERLLSVWVEDQNQRNTRGNVVLVQEKTAACSRSSGSSRARAPSRRPSGQPGPVRRLQGALQAAHPGAGRPGGARSPWGARRYCGPRRVIQEEDLTARQVFSVEETRLFWRRLLDGTVPSARRSALGSQPPEIY
ncbi:tigger transposable element-derived protein 1-like [Phacochoerus africanus]|uniref:tigger transposable element-derived protein 1-like n=1 Tax=Phacochoerus africanus TaxID=41426 RepID=UPI001FDA5798|nr:tigger transposable element-derived protein 1-like [Phacochoerus africanus]XP_047646904.1 tigger transposable element-derived protein 1-like [Phacochoerus africanus]XP_047646905.1 tigger transposable element-derived protein 1-like [Phacochoerus africanus]XP_047646906.1 tigger transposable element-derived protein 1-like [Phacochoerus africanus]XP_047646907.1 tigger transposable element-derived protein 1-like [Phacochoerus africanus]XP_047646908.1 tigger transposable element-derived protein 1